MQGAIKAALEACRRRGGIDCYIDTEGNGNNIARVDVPILSPNTINKSRSSTQSSDKNDNHNRAISIQRESRKLKNDLTQKYIYEFRNCLRRNRCDKYYGTQVELSFFDTANEPCSIQLRQVDVIDGSGKRNVRNKRVSHEYSLKHGSVVDYETYRLVCGVLQPRNKPDAGAIEACNKWIASCQRP